MRNIKLILGLCCILSNASYAANSVNQLDTKGNRQGFWTITGTMARDVNYPGNARVEEGQYVDGKKIGTWKKFYIPYTGGGDLDGSSQMSGISDSERLRDGESVTG